MTQTDALASEATATPQQVLAVIDGLLSNGYGPEHLAAFCTVAVGKDVTLDEMDYELSESAAELIEAGYLNADADGILSVQPYEPVESSPASAA